MTNATRPVPPCRHRSTTGRCTARGRSTRRATTRRSRRRSSKNLADIVSEEAIITVRRQEDRQGADPLAGGVPASASTTASSKHVGQGEGDSKVGDVIGQAATAQGQGRARAAGRRAAGHRLLRGRDHASTSWPRWSSRTWGCRTWKTKRQQELESRDVRFNDIRKHGAMSNLDKRRTILENLKRNARDGRRRASATCSNDDLRFKTWERGRPPRVERRGHRHDGRLAARWASSRSTSPAASTSGWCASCAPSTSNVRDRLHHPPHRGEGGRRGDVLQPRRERRHARSRRPTSWRCEIIDERYPPERVEHLPVPLLGRRQLARGDNQLCVRAGAAAARARATSSATARSRRAAAARPAR